MTTKVQLESVEMVPMLPNRSKLQQLFLLTPGITVQRVRKSTLMPPYQNSNGRNEAIDNANVRTIGTEKDTASHLFN